MEFKTKRSAATAQDIYDCIKWMKSGTIDEIVKKSGYGRQGVRDAVDAFFDVGLVEIVVRKHEGRRRQLVRLTGKKLTVVVLSEAKEKPVKELSPVTEKAKERKQEIHSKEKAVARQFDALTAHFFGLQVSA